MVHTTTYNPPSLVNRYRTISSHISKIHPDVVPSVDSIYGGGFNLRVVDFISGLWILSQGCGFYLRVVDFISAFVFNSHPLIIYRDYCRSTLQRAFQAEEQQWETLFLASLLLHSIVSVRNIWPDLGGSEAFSLSIFFWSVSSVPGRAW